MSDFEVIPHPTFRHMNVPQYIPGIQAAIQEYHKRRTMLKRIFPRVMNIFLTDRVLKILGYDPLFVVVASMCHCLQGMHRTLTMTMPMDDLRFHFPYRLSRNYYSTWAFGLLPEMTNLANWRYVVEKYPAIQMAGRSVWEYNAPFPDGSGKRMVTRVEWQGGDTLYIGTEATFCIMDPAIDFWLIQNTLPFEHLMVDEPHGQYEFSAPWPKEIDRLADACWWTGDWIPSQPLSSTSSCCNKNAFCPPPAKRGRFD